MLPSSQSTRPSCRPSRVMLLHAPAATLPGRLCCRRSGPTLELLRSPRCRLVVLQVEVGAGDPRLPTSCGSLLGPEPAHTPAPIRIAHQAVHRWSGFLACRVSMVLLLTGWQADSRQYQPRPLQVRHGRDTNPCLLGDRDLLVTHPAAAFRVAARNWRSKHESPPISRTKPDCFRCGLSGACFALWISKGLSQVCVCVCVVYPTPFALSFARMKCEPNTLAACLRATSSSGFREEVARRQAASVLGSHFILAKLSAKGVGYTTHTHTLSSNPYCGCTWAAWQGGACSVQIIPVSCFLPVFHPGFVPVLGISGSRRR